MCKMGKTWLCFPMTSNFGLLLSPVAAPDLNIYLVEYPKHSFPEKCMFMGHLSSLSTKVKQISFVVKLSILIFCTLITWPWMNATISVISVCLILLLVNDLIRLRYISRTSIFFILWSKYFFDLNKWSSRWNYKLCKNILSFHLSISKILRTKAF